MGLEWLYFWLGAGGEKPGFFADLRSKSTIFHRNPEYARKRRWGRVYFGYLFVSKIIGKTRPYTLENLPSRCIRN